jgi:hypothetical protein
VTIFFIDVLLTLALIKQAKFLICDSKEKFQNDLDDQDLILATVPSTQFSISTLFDPLK